MILITHTGELMWTLLLCALHMCDGKTNLKLDNNITIRGVIF